MAGENTALAISKAMVTEPVPSADWLVIAPLIVTILGGALCVMTRKRMEYQPQLAFVFLTALVAVNIGLLSHVTQNGVVVMVMGKWLAPFGIAFSVDTTSAVLSLVASLVAWCVGLYGIVDVNNTGRRYGFYPFLLLLMTGVCGSFLTGDIFNLYVWFEVLLISSFGLIILGNEKIQLDGALKYAVLNFTATTLFLIATGLLYGMVGTLNMADIAVKVKNLPDSAPLGAVTALYLLAFGMKAAAFPVNFWLPASYHTPRIVVSAVFAGLLTKVGVYALLRTLIMLLPEGRSAMADVIAIIAVITMLTGVFGALAQTDIRKALGYLVISGIGSMLAGMAIGTGSAVAGSLFYAVHSIIVMTALYLAAGLIGRMGGSFDVRQLGGLYKGSPVLAGLFLVLCFAVAGLPPFSGFWPKVILVETSLKESYYWVAAALLLTGFLTTLSVGRIWVYAFWRGGPESAPDNSEEAKLIPLTDGLSGSQAALWIPIGLLVTMVVLIGVAPEPIFKIVGRGAAGLLDPTAYISEVLGGAP